MKSDLNTLFRKAQKKDWKALHPDINDECILTMVYWMICYFFFTSTLSIYGFKEKLAKT